MKKSKAKRVLVVDEEKDQHFLYSLKLNQLGLEVGFAENALQAAQALTSGIRFDLIVSNYDLPKMSGVELHDHIKKQNLSIPFILLSKESDRIKDHYGQSWSQENVLEKPLDYDQLAKLVCQKLDKD